MVLATHSGLLGVDSMILTLRYGVLFVDSSVRTGINLTVWCPQCGLVYTPGCGLPCVDCQCRLQGVDSAVFTIKCGLYGVDNAVLTFSVDSQCGLHSVDYTV